MSLSRTSLIAVVVVANLCFCRGAALAQARPDRRSAAAAAEVQAARAGAGGETLQAINEDYNRQLLQLERQRLERLGPTGRAPVAQGGRRDLRELVPPGHRQQPVPRGRTGRRRSLEVRRAAPPPVVRFLAETIDIIASADRGAYDESLADLRTARSARRRSGQAAAARRPCSTRPSLLAICEAYYQRLVQGEPVRRGPQGLSTARAGGRQPRRQGVLHAPAQPARPDRQAGPADPGDRPRRQAGEPGRRSRATSSWSSSGRAGACPTPPRSPGSIRSTRRTATAGFRIVGINVDTLQNGGPEARDASCPTSGGSSWTTTSAGRT